MQPNVNPESSPVPNIALLSASQAFSGSAQGIVMAVGALAGITLAPDPALATLPATMTILGLAASAIPATMIIYRLGRKSGFTIGALLAIVAGLAASYSVAISNFVLFCLSLSLVGSATAFAQQYRFAAADSVDLKWKPRAISFVLLGGVMAGFLGPRLSYMFKDVVAGHEFSGSFLVISILSGLAALMISFTRLAPVAHPAPNESTGRPLWELIRTPSVFVPVLSGMASYALMTFVMVAAPLAMVRICGHPVDTATTAIQWHIVAMFAPSFITGTVINRIGAHLTAGIGLFMILISAAISLDGVSAWHFYLALVFLGTGWNFGFIGSTTLLSESYGPLEAARVQGMNEQLVFGTMAVASIGSGTLLQMIGWQAVNVLVIPIATAAIALLAWGYGQSKKERREIAV